MGYLLGLDIGSSAVKAALLDSESGKVAASCRSPEGELPINSPNVGWAEQDPEVWWKHVKFAIAGVLHSAGISGADVQAIGIAYQMHGLVLVDRDYQPLRSSIIWCDSRAVSIGDNAFNNIGSERCLEHFLNSPGNFTASKLKWVIDNEPAIFDQVYKAMLPGDYIALCLTGEATTTVSGLSEGILWDFKQDGFAELVAAEYGFDQSIFPQVVDTIGNQGELSGEAASELGLKPGTPIAYRAGDQPNNALSLNVLEPGEVAATAGTSGVVYGVGAEPNYDPLSRVNTFAHVNHSTTNPRYGVLLCVNGTGILNSWLRNNFLEASSYDQINELAMSVPVGAEGLTILPYGNGAERSLGNKDIGASVHGLSLTRHGAGHVARAAQEGIVFALNYGFEIFKSIGINPTVIRAGHDNMFLSPLFREAFASVTGATIQLYDTDGAQGAARGAGVGAGVYGTFKEAFASLETLEAVEPDTELVGAYQDAYGRWNEVLKSQLD